MFEKKNSYKCLGAKKRDLSLEQNEILWKRERFRLFKRGWKERKIGGKHIKWVLALYPEKNYKFVSDLHVEFSIDRKKLKIMLLLTSIEHTCAKHCARHCRPIT